MKDRIRTLRKALDLTQQEFADRIGVKRNTVGQYEIGRNDPTDTVISLICKEYNVNEKWLRSGEGEMFIPDAKDELDALAKKYNYSGAIQVLIEKLVTLPPNQQEAVTDFLIEFAAGVQSLKDAGSNPRHTIASMQSEMSIDEKVEAYRKALEQEKEAEEKSEVS